MGFRRFTIPEPRVELTPMIDVVFLLLIFFMISTTFVENPGIVIDLPESTAQELNKMGNEIQVYLTEDGKIYCQQQEISLENLNQRLQSYGPDVNQMRFLLMADQAVTHGRVVQLMDIARSAGFAKLAIATDKEASSSGTVKDMSHE